MEKVFSVGTVPRLYNEAASSAEITEEVSWTEVEND
jgi:hypothetical protein